MKKLEEAEPYEWEKETLPPEWEGKLRWCQDHCPKKNCQCTKDFGIDRREREGNDTIKQTWHWLGVRDDEVLGLDLE